MKSLPWHMVRATGAVWLLILVTPAMALLLPKPVTPPFPGAPIPDFPQEFNACIARIQQCQDPMLNLMLNTLRQSSNVHVVTRLGSCSNSSENIPCVTRPVPSYWPLLEMGVDHQKIHCDMKLGKIQGVGDSSVTQWEPGPCQNVLCGVRQDPCATLVHELWHAFERDQGLHDPANKTPGIDGLCAVPETEAHGVYAENLFRSCPSENQPRRCCYRMPDKPECALETCVGPIAAKWKLNYGMTAQTKQIPAILVDTRIVDWPTSSGPFSVKVEDAYHLGEIMFTVGSTANTLTVDINGKIRTHPHGTACGARDSVELHNNGGPTAKAWLTDPEVQSMSAIYEVRITKRVSPGGTVCGVSAGDPTTSDVVVRNGTSIYGHGEETGVRIGDNPYNYEAFFYYIGGLGFPGHAENSLDTSLHVTRDIYPTKRCLSSADCTDMGEATACLPLSNDSHHPTACAKP